MYCMIREMNHRIRVKESFSGFLHCLRNMVTATAWIQTGVLNYVLIKNHQLLTIGLKAELLIVQLMHTSSDHLNFERADVSCLISSSALAMHI